MRRQARVPGAQKIHLVRPMHEADMLDRINEFAGLIDHACRDRVAPKLFGVRKLLINLNDLLHLNGPIGFPLGGITELANPRMPRARVVPAI